MSLNRRDRVGDRVGDRVAAFEAIARADTPKSDNVNENKEVGRPKAIPVGQPQENCIGAVVRTLCIRSVTFVVEGENLG